MATRRLPLYSRCWGQSFNLTSVKKVKFNWFRFWRLVLPHSECVRELNRSSQVLFFWQIPLPYLLTLLPSPFVVFVVISFVTFRLVFGSVRFGYGSLVFFFFFVAVRVAWGKKWNSCGSVGFSFFFWCSLSVNTCNAAEERVKNAMWYTAICAN